MNVKSKLLFFYVLQNVYEKLNRILQLNIYYFSVFASIFFDVFLKIFFLQLGKNNGPYTGFTYTKCVIVRLKRVRINKLCTNKKKNNY